MDCSLIHALLTNPAFLTLAFLFISVFVYYHRQNRVRWLTRNIPGPPEFPLFGNINIFGDTFDFQEIHNKIYRSFDRYGEIVKFWFGHELWICTCDASLAKEIFMNWRSYETIPAYNFFGFFKDKCFHARTLYGVNQVFDMVVTPSVESSKVSEAVTRCISSLRSSAGTGVATASQIKSSIKNCIEDLMTETKWSINLTEDYRRRVFGSIQDSWDIFMWRTSSYISIQFSEFLLKYIKSPILDGVKIQMFTVDINTKFPKFGNFDSDKFKGEKMHMDYTPQYYECYRKRVYDTVAAQIAEVVDQMTHLFLNTLQALTADPRLMAKVREEVERVRARIGSHDIGLEHERKLVYTEMVLKEALRLYAPPCIALRCSSDFPVDSSKTSKTLPANSVVYLDVYHLHMNHQHYEEPIKFYPEHFEQLKEIERSDGAYFPLTFEPGFPGDKRFALKLMKIMLASIAGNLSFESSIEPEQIEHNYFNLRKNVESMDLTCKGLKSS